MTNVPKGWSRKNDKLIGVFQCSDFQHAVALLNSVADIAEKHQHHPDIGIRNYNEVLISTTTHSVNKLTEKDYELAEEISQLLNYETQKYHIETNGRGT